MKEVITELGPTKEMDYLYILRALNEIKFPVGKTLLIDFLSGNIKNASIKKNELFNLQNFRSLRKYPEEEIRNIIDNLITNSMIESSSLIGNKFAQVLGITSKGTEELMNPTLHKKKISNSIEIENHKTNITPEEKILFKELDSFLTNFNDEQKKAIILQNKNILCIAGAGSGKTTVLVKRIEFLIKYQSIEPQKILAITFTRKARQEMESRLLKLGISGVNVETFNSFSEKILQKYGHLFYDSPKRVMSYQDKIVAFNFALNNLGLNLEYVINRYFSENQKRNKEPHQLTTIFMNDCFSVIEYFKSKNEELKDFSKDISDKDEKEMAKTISKICQSIELQMKMQGLRDYVDQLKDAIELLTKFKHLIPELQNILVDEYQDVNAMQIQLLEILTNGNLTANLFAVGDPRQSIFGWRGSDVNYILKFKEKYTNCEVVNLVKNYRSAQEIVKFMNHSIKDMKMHDLESNSQSTAEIKMFNFDSEEFEHQFILNQLSKFLKSKISGDEIFVLARTNRQLTELSKKLKLSGISHVVKTDELKKPIESHPGDITLATIHAIKGLESQIVFVIGCNEQNFPCKASDHPIIEMAKMEMQEYDKEEEERRLFYVAISRAKEKLFLSYSGKKPTYFINEEMKKILLN